MPGRSHQQSTLRAVVVADGDVEPVAVARALYVPPGTSLMVIGADGGARKARLAGLTLDLVVGDGDSLDPETRAWLEGSDVEIRDASPRKDESDTELCLLAALERGADEVRVVGALGGPRPEHSVANILLLGHALLDETDAALLTATSVLRRIGTAGGSGRLHLQGEIGDLVSLFALDGRVEGVSTRGLRYPLRDEPLLSGPARGLSNELTARSGGISTRRGRLLVIHTTITPGEGWT